MGDQDAGVCLLVLCGLPGAGKTTVSELLARDMPSASGLQLDVAMVCFDSYEHEGLDVGADGAFSPERWKVMATAAQLHVRCTGCMCV